MVERLVTFNRSSHTPLVDRWGYQGVSTQSGLRRGFNLERRMCNRGPQSESGADLA